MPIKRGNRGRRGLSTGPERSVIKRQSGSTVQTHHRKRSAATKFLARIAEFAFNSVVQTACNFYVIPMKYENDVCFLTSTNLPKLLHNFALLFFFACMANMIYICTWLIFEDFSITTLVSLTILLFYLFAGSLGCCNILISRETVQLVNSWRQVLGILGGVRGRRVDMFEDVTLNIKVTLAVGPAILGPLILSALPLVFPELPVSMQFQMKQLLPDLPDIWTQLVCLPLEMIASLVALLNAAFGVCVLVIGIDLLNMFGQFMRRLPLITAAHHHQMKQTYMFFKVYNTILDVWFKFVGPQTFFLASSTIIVFLYITIRHTELPVYIYSFYPYLAVLTFFIMFGLCYDGLVAINVTEYTLSRLRSRRMKCFRRMPDKDRAVGLRWAKAMKPVICSVGMFTEFNAGVPIGLWDEIINQLVLLLTL